MWASKIPNNYQSWIKSIANAFSEFIEENQLRKECVVKMTKEPWSAEAFAVLNFGLRLCVSWFLRSAAYVC